MWTHGSTRGRSTPPGLSRLDERRRITRALDAREGRHLPDVAALYPRVRLTLDDIEDGARRVLANELVQAGWPVRAAGVAFGVRPRSEVAA